MLHPHARFVVPATAVVLCLLPSAGAGQTQDEYRAAYYDAVAAYFKVGPEEVRIIGEWRVEPEDIPVVLFLARRAGISPDAAAAERSRGTSWDGLMRRYGVQISAVHVPLQTGTELGPLASLYDRLEQTSRSTWNRIELSDTEVKALVNLRVLSSSLRVAPERILRLGAGEGGFLAVPLRLAGR